MSRMPVTRQPLDVFVLHSSCAMSGMEIMTGDGQPWQMDRDAACQQSLIISTPDLHAGLARACGALWRLLAGSTDL